MSSFEKAPGLSDSSNVQLRLDPAEDGETNMRMDRDLLQAVETAPGLMTVVRVYSWNPPAVSIGRNQKLETALNFECCRRRKVQVVRRPTGGRAVYHDDEVTYTVVSNAPAWVGGGIEGSYRIVAGILCSALERLGVAAELAKGADRRALRPRLGREFCPPCFAASSRCEIVVRGRKLVGSAQYRTGRSFLQHGSLPLRIDYPTMAELLGCSPELLEAAMVSLEEAAGRAVSRWEAAEALIQSFRRATGRKCSSVELGI
ncbi:MAG TPA: lipoate--protein ligase family protein [Acidobacteriota bacterium]|nr:lipoate--protein ligase family protein [Acidobacteriota bacterium]